ncbi:MAG: RibD family protein [Aquabacterium sp.]|jgi:diaminohydroxyphosphoribosylaminopyrimidine deaminase / 5-amino-6-(5-phosphoribosylamino)uracil reductase|uniref:RibD family protein n=1 Tax=Aquabacterium sp. TaxID=1872578 RepID=UPI003BAF61EB
MTAATELLSPPATVALHGEDPAWQALLRQGGPGEGGVPFLDGESLLHALYGPLCAMRRRGSTYVVGHLAQSLDGRIATTCGVSRWLSGDEDLLHTHRMRAIADAVLVGASTVQHDDPQLTVRLCAGEHPTRVILDPERRLDGSQKVFTDGKAPTLLLVAADRMGRKPRCGQAEVIPISRGEHGLDPFEIRRVLALRGLHWLFVEGGGITVSRFLAAGALDRLQITVAPVIIGSGRPSLVLPEIHDLAHSLRPRTRRFLLGDDTMIECAFHE